jgi:hypothetical protein
MPDYPIRVKVAIEFFTLATAAPVEEKDDNDGGNGSNASGNTTSNSSSIAAFARRGRWHNDNCRLNGGGNYQAIGFRRFDYR